jgi:superfamily II DNA helicase RecQ
MYTDFSKFNRFLSDLEHNRRLASIVFDEIHKIITDSGYRVAFKNFSALHTVDAVVFGLTGSLPPVLYPVLCELTSMTWKVLRTSSARKELKYQVMKVPTEVEMNSAIVAHLQKSIASYSSEDRAMAFCRSKQQVTELAALFNVDPYYAVHEDEEALERNRKTKERWLRGENKVMISTSILGCGLDYAHIRDVVHRDPSFTMLDHYQEDSRGGRDGLECRATTFVVLNKKYRVPDQPYDLGTQVLYDSMEQAQQCRRIPPTLYLDGQGKQCVTIPGASFCDLCEKSTAGHVPINPPIVHSPPRRLPDIFDKSPHDVLQNFLNSQEKRTHSLDSTSSDSSKRLKLTHNTSFEM